MEILLKISILHLCLFFSYNIKSQDAAFSQFYAAPVFLNPSLVGGDNTIAVNLNYQANTNKYLYPHNLGQFTFSLPILMNTKKRIRKKIQLKNYVGSIAITAYNEFIGAENEFRITGLNLTTTYFTQVGLAHFLAFGVQLGMINKSIDYSKLTWGSQFTQDFGFDSRIAPSVILSNEKKTFLVVNAGVTWFYNFENFSAYENSRFRTFVGFAVSNLNKPDDSFYDLDVNYIPMLYKLHGGITIPLSDRYELIPNYLIMHQGNVSYFNIGTYIAYYISPKLSNNSSYWQIQLGCWYRFGDSFIASLGFEMKNLIFGISYDLNMSNFKYNNKGVRTIEISIKYKTNSRTKENRRNISHPII